MYCCMIEEREGRRGRKGGKEVGKKGKRREEEKRGEDKRSQKLNTKKNGCPLSPIPSPISVIFPSSL